MKIITNNVPRELLTWWDLTAAEREDFDWTQEDGADTFFRYKGLVYCTGEFMNVSSTELPLATWQGIHADSLFSAIVLRYTDDDQVIVGMALA